MTHLSHFYLQKNPINYILVIVGENMKKILVFMITFLVGLVCVNAESLKCTYSVGAAKYVVTYKTGDSGLTKSVTADNSMVATTVKINSDFVLSNFRDENGNLKCLSEVFASEAPSGSGRNMNYNLTTIKKNVTVDGKPLQYNLIESESEVVNDPKDPDEPKDKIISCNITDGDIKIVVSFNVTQNKIVSYEAPGGYTVSNSILKPEDFKNGQCPEKGRFKIVCTTRGGKYCAINDLMGETIDEPTTEPNASEIEDQNHHTPGNSNLGASLKDPSLTGFGNTGDSCSAVLGTTFTALVKEVIKWVRIAGGIIAIVNGMLKLIPAIMSKDAEALSKAARTCVIMAIILVFCALFPWLLNLIGSIFKWDVSCIV